MSHGTRDRLKSLVKRRSESLDESQTPITEKGRESERPSSMEDLLEVLAVSAAEARPVGASICTPSTASGSTTTVTTVSKESVKQTNSTETGSVSPGPANLPLPGTSKPAQPQRPSITHQKSTPRFHDRELVNAGPSTVSGNMQ